MVSNMDIVRDHGNKKTGVVIMDFAKVFDKVLHMRLLYKLNHYPIRRSTQKWTSIWLSERSQKVVLDTKVSDPVPVLSGIPKGVVFRISPLLIFI